jgi:hypothetical protein
MSGAFISYAREDQPFAQRLYDALFKAGREPNVLALGTYGLVKHRCSGTAHDP